MPELQLSGCDGATRAHGAGLRRFRCRYCGNQFNERSAGLLNRTQYPSDVIALVMLRYRLTVREALEEGLAIATRLILAFRE